MKVKLSLFLSILATGMASGQNPLDAVSSVNDGNPEATVRIGGTTVSSSDDNGPAPTQIRYAHPTPNTSSSVVPANNGQPIVINNHIPAQPQAAQPSITINNIMPAQPAPQYQYDQRLYERTAVVVPACATVIPVSNPGPYGYRTPFDGAATYGYYGYEDCSYPVGYAGGYGGYAGGGGFNASIAVGGRNFAGAFSIGNGGFGIGGAYATGGRGYAGGGRGGWGGGGRTIVNNTTIVNNSGYRGGGGGYANCYPRVTNPGGYGRGTPFDGRGSTFCSPARSGGGWGSGGHGGFSGGRGGHR